MRNIRTMICAATVVAGVAVTALAAEPVQRYTMDDAAHAGTASGAVTYADGV